jgi:DNA-directed RNA polymerase subunit RPC12/RpoP
MVKGLATKLLGLLGFFFRECNICGQASARFESSEWHKYIICPNCKSQVRHRLLVAALTEIEEFKGERLLHGKSVLHFAPEKFWRSFLAEC